MKIQEEINELEKRFSRAPDSRLFLPLADALRRAGELERAIKLCREGLARYPDFTSARVLLAECLAALGKLEEAESIFEELARADAGNVMVLSSLAEVAGQRGGRSNAGQARDRIQPEEAGAQEPSGAVDMEEVSLSEGEAPEGAPADFGNADPGSVFLTHTLADIYRLQGHYSKAYEIYLKLSETAAGDPDLERKLTEVRSRLEGTSPPAGIPGAGRTGSRAGIAAPAEDDFETRIDAIFHFLLGEAG